MKGGRRAAAASSLLAVGGVLAALACGVKLPDPESPGAKLYASRCGDPCHRLYAPRIMKYQMWKIQVERMQGEMVRRGIPPLTTQERMVLLGYLKRHGG